MKYARQKPPARYFLTAALSFTALMAANAGPISAARRSDVPQHLYVADPGAGVVLRYPLTNGLPAVEPDATMNEFVNPTFIAGDGATGIFVAGNTGSGRCYIEPIGGSGASIILTYNIGSLATDVAGYLYTVVGTGGSLIFVYAPKASGYDPVPTAVLKTQDRILNLQSDHFGRLFASSIDDIDVFDHPTRNAKKPSWEIGQPSQFFSFGGPMSFDERNTLYISSSPLGIYSAWQDEDFAAIRPLRGSGMKYRTILARDCYTDKSEPSEPNFPGIVTGMSVSQGYLEDACYGSTPPSVDVYRADDFHRQHMVEILQGTHNPTDVKAGP